MLTRPPDTNGERKSKLLEIGQILGEVVQFFKIEDGLKSEIKSQIEKYDIDCLPLKIEFDLDYDKFFGGIYEIPNLLVERYFLRIILEQDPKNSSFLEREDKFFKLVMPNEKIAEKLV